MIKIRDARNATDGRHVTASRQDLSELGVRAIRVSVDRCIRATHRAQSGPREAIAACRGGNSLVVTTLDRLARSVPNARDLVDELTARGVRLNLGGSVHDPAAPVGRLLFTVLSMIVVSGPTWPGPGASVRTTISLSDDLNAQLLSISRDRRESVSRTVVVLLQRALAQDRPSYRMVRNPRTGFVGADFERPLTEDDVRSLDDDE